MNQLERIALKHGFNLKAFELAKENYYSNCGVKILNSDDPKSVINRDESISKASESFYNFCMMLRDILLICADEAELREDFELFHNDIQEIIPKACLQTETNIKITIGLFRDFYIFTKINLPNSLYSMDDEFWFLLCQLSDIGKFSFKEEHTPSREIRKKYPQLFNKRGNIYKLFRNFLLNQIEYGFCNSIGYIEVRWENNIKSDKLILNYCKAFKIMHRINFLLWCENKKMLKKDNL